MRRCAGASRGGCQAECRFYWKESWLRRVDEHDAVAEGEPAAPAHRELARAVEATTRPREWNGTDEQFRCQATEAFRATEPLSGRDPRQYAREVRSGNVPVHRVLRVLARGLWWSVGRKTGLRPLLPVKVPRATRSESETLDLRPGEWVEVRSG